MDVKPKTRQSRRLGENLGQPDVTTDSVECDDLMMPHDNPIRFDDIRDFVPENEGRGEGDMATQGAANGVNIPCDTMHHGMVNDLIRSDLRNALSGQCCIHSTWGCNI